MLCFGRKMKICFLVFLLLNVFQTSGIQFTKQYNGKSVKGLVGSSLNFTWSFSGNIRSVQWGLKRAGLEDINSSLILAALDQSGPQEVTVHSAYAGRVFGYGDISSGWAIFTLSSIMQRDEGAYGCKLTDTTVPFFTTKFDSVELVVEEKPTIVRPVDANASYSEESPVDVICEARGNPVPNVEWIHKGQVKSSGSKTANLTFGKITRDNAGEYICRATSPVGNAEKQLNLVVNYEPEGVNITTSTAQNTAIQGQDVTLTCHVTAAIPPVSEYRFYLNDSNTALNTLTNINQHTIQGVQRTRDYGKYKCVAKNVAGEAQSNAVVLDIHVPAKIQPKIANVTVNEEDPIDLKCEASGYPAPRVTWTKDGRSLQSAVAGVIHIGKSKRDDSGAYVCKADNNVGQADQIKVFVTVNYAATIKGISSSVSKSWIGQTVRLSCVSDGVPTPTLSWYTPERTKFNPVKAKENTVDVKMNSDQDFGLYNCTADNGFDPASLTVRVQQIKAPGPPSINSTAADIQATSLTVKWTAPADDGGSTITAYRVVIVKGGNETKNENVTNHSLREKFIGGLEKSTNYTVKVYARNYVFEGNAGQKIIKTKYEGVPAAAEIVDLPAETKDVDITIKWNEPQNNGAPIANYTVYQRTVNDDGTQRDWNAINVIKDRSVRQVAVKLEKGKNYEFVVTAANRFGESLKEGEKIKKIVVLGGVPAAVQFTADEKDGVITLKWTKPENNGAAIKNYSVYERFVNDKEWKKLEDITDTSKLDYVLKGEKGKEYEFVVTATNKYGESSKTANIQTVKVLKGTVTDEQKHGSGGMNMAVIAGAAAAGVLLILALIIFGIWWKRRKAPSEHGSSVADLSGRNPDDFDDGYHAVGAAAAAHQLQASGRAAEATYAQVDMSQKKNRRPVTDLYAEVDKSKKTKKKRQKQPGELDYAELDDLRPNFQPAPQPPGAAARPLVRAPAYEGTEYADITQFGVPQPEPTYDNVPKKDVVYSNVESM